MRARNVILGWYLAYELNERHQCLFPLHLLLLDLCVFFDKANSVTFVSYLLSLE